MKHIATEQLKKYGERQLGTDEMTRIILHLDGCRVCLDSLQRMFPALGDSSREISISDLTMGDEEIFHLDYEEHLRPFIDFEADEVIREIVESHVLNCPFCARAVRELREFSDSLRLRGSSIRKVEKDKDDALPSTAASDAPVYRPHRFSNENLLRVALPAVTIMFLGLGGWLFWLKSETTTFVAENHLPKDALPISANKNSINRPSEDPAANREIKQIEPPIPVREAGSANKKTTAAEDTNRELIQTKEMRLLAALPPDFRAQFQAAVQTQKIAVPAFITDLSEKSNLRGASGSEESPVMSPNAQAVRDVRPTLSWHQFADDDDSYLVTIYDQNFNRVVASESLHATKWQSDVSLKRGAVYKWQVTGAKSGKSYAAQFKVLGDDALIKLKKIENAAPHSPLILGIGYASEGLLIEAEREFQRAIRSNSSGHLAKKLNDSLIRKPKRR